MPDRYKLLIGCIVPRPIALVSTLSPEGHPNLAPFSFFNGVGSEPMSLMFCPANNLDGTPKDTLRNAAPPEDGGTGEFVVHIVSDALARQMSVTAEPLDYTESEFTLAGLTPLPSATVAPPRVAECPACFECRTTQVIRLGPGVPAGGNIVIGEVTHIHAHDDLVSDRFHIDPALLDAIGRMGGRSYCRTRDRFDLPSGKAAIAPH